MCFLAEPFWKLYAGFLSVHAGVGGELVSVLEVPWSPHGSGPGLSRLTSSFSSAGCAESPATMVYRWVNVFHNFNPATSATHNARHSYWWCTAAFSGECLHHFCGACAQDLVCYVVGRVLSAFF
jgi:hypothetical protein